MLANALHEIGMNQLGSADEPVIILMSQIDALTASSTIGTRICYKHLLEGIQPVMSLAH
jgi:hypothetical protein